MTNNMIFSELSLRLLTCGDAGRRRCTGRLLLAAILTLPACTESGAASAQEAEKPNVTGRDHSYAVAGIEPGFEASQVELAAAKAGYKLVLEDKGADWQMEMKNASRANRFPSGDALTGIRSHEFLKGAEMLIVSYVAMPQGAVAYRVSYTAPAAVTDYSRAAEVTTQRYGKSSFSNQAGRWSKWCPSASKSEQDCLKQPHLSLSATARGVSISAQDEGVRDKQVRLLQEQLGAKPTF